MKPLLNLQKNKHRQFQVYTYIKGQKYWWQEGCMGRYWGSGEHKETLLWTDFKRGHTGFDTLSYGGQVGSLLELSVISVSENINLYLVEPDTDEVFKIIQPNWLTRFHLWRRDALKHITDGHQLQ